MTKKKQDGTDDTTATANSEPANQGAAQPTSDAIGQLAALVQEHADALTGQLEAATAAIDEKAGRLHARLDELASRFDDLAAAMGRTTHARASVDELAAQLHDFGVRLGLVPKGAAAATEPAQPAVPMIHDGSGWVPDPAAAAKE